MKKIIFLLFALTLNTNANLTATATSESRLTLQEQAFNAKIELQDQAIQNLKSQFEETNKYQDLRKDVLDSQENSIGWWLSTIGNWLTVISIFVALFGVISFFVAKDKIQKFKQLNEYVKDKIQEFEQLNKNAETELEKIKQYAKTAKQGAAAVTKLKKETAESLANPEKSPSPQVFAEVEQSGSKLEKQILIARKLQKDNKIEQAITLWQEIVTIAKYENNKEQQANGYFYLGYLYGKLGGEDNLQKTIAAYQKAIEIKPDLHEAYYNMGNTYYKLGGKDNLQKAIAAYQKAIEIKPNKYKAYYNMGNAYDSLEQFDKAIDNYETAISINPDIGKEIEQEDYDILTHRIETLDESATKQKYQAILRKLKGE